MKMSPKRFTGDFQNLQNRENEISTIAATVDKNGFHVVHGHSRPSALATSIPKVGLIIITLVGWHCFPALGTVPK
jgi:hypothetical protein